jgi:hypothetical protein
MNLDFFKKMFQLPLQVPAEPAPKAMGSSWRGIVGLAVMATAGAVGLFRLAIQVTNPPQSAAEEKTNRGAIVRGEVKSLWLHPAFYALAHQPPEAAAAESQEAFQSYAKRHGLDGAWYVITTRHTLADGRVEVSSTIRRPFEMPIGHFSEFPAVLAAAASTPPGLPSGLAGFSKPKIFVIPERLLKSDPREAFDELRLLEDRLGESEAP